MGRDQDERASGLAGSLLLLGAGVHGIPGPVCVGMCWNKHIILLYSLGNGRKKRVEVGALGRCQDVIEERVVDT